MFRSDPIPSTPGVYLMREASGKIIYIGKAKNLKKRLSSYFQKKPTDSKIYVLFQSLRSIDFVKCASEREALLLEERLIKTHNPIFNSMWKDDKTYPYAVLTTQDDFPRLYLARKKHIPVGARLFGPYPSVGKVRALIRGLFRSGAVPLRPCRWEFSLKKPLDPKIINSCVYYQTKACPAPCAYLISKKDYRTLATRAELIFSGQTRRLELQLETQMKQAARDLQFERAGQIKKQWEALGHIKENVVVNLIQQEDLALFHDPNKALESLKNSLGLNNLPTHIEAFDISNLFGAYAVGSMVCFKEGKLNKDHYRRFRIKTVSGIDDVAMIREVVTRRSRRLLEEGGSLPDLILLDGGPGQLSAAREALEEVGLSSKIALAALAKKQERLYACQKGEIKEIRLPKINEGLRLAQAIRDEAHRFAIEYHRTLRREAYRQASLEETQLTHEWDQTLADNI